jgi:hypothetical protein
MKRFMIAILVHALASPMFVGCKKGANDPGLSLKSRNSRLIGEWKLVSFEGTYQGVSGGSAYTTTYKFDGNNYTASSSGSSVSGTGSFTMEIAKDGIYTYSESFTPSGGAAVVTNGSNFWYWGDNDNNKIAVSFGDGGYNLFFTGLYNIDKLSSKQLVLKRYYSYNDDGEIYARDFTYTFEPK